jgi:hypothetical protein
MTWKNELILLGYLALFGACVAVLLWRQKCQRKTRLPFGEDLKLLRAPGETQLGLVRKLEEDSLIWLLGAAALPLTVFIILGFVTVRLPATVQLGGVAITLLAAGATFYVSAKWFAGKTREIGNRYLGYFGERVVAEHLEPLKAQGWRIFHDVPATANGHPFNLDHVAVGPTGAYVIESKTRRKGGARPGFDDHKVYFDGHVLVWPWGEDNHGLEQAERNAIWLADTLLAETGEHVPVMPVLILPGWWVEMKPSRDPRPCRVTNPKGLSKFLPGGVVVLAQDQIAAIAAKLEARCRDVAY